MMGPRVSGPGFLDRRSLDPGSWSSGFRDPVSYVLGPVVMDPPFRLCHKQAPLKEQGYYNFPQINIPSNFLDSTTDGLL